ncbi:tRNA preQ1(34) S-adenosylmethionine ribosyltransferase-isomerase QueA [Tautonia plasticadhaerens]|uniref:S-adenosylmethionine:tRNA ribosyltransferase-isomerase n=1 Tax=Tautonia plasticadhaerens TaxID=2527974 RepID=A0A518H2F6_9BACT|nr:tRNA preQ1(34) S-adenosylmethionine ribosyltransferase-isomerase QueA [Tautonia plasticadhaerens]QDV35015.1 S-adenosylmethionine:tRNA ribosyltransferase-isomerase [Tautonia plasticadhaerens]
MRTEDFDFHLPDDLIAQHPNDRRDRSRLMVVRRDTGAIEHRVFDELPGLLRAGDLLVRNDSRVVPARLLGRREETGGRWEGLYLSERPGGAWELMAQTRGRPQPGEAIVLDGGLRLELVERLGGGHWLARPLDPRPSLELLDAFGHVPLPPYIYRDGGGDDPTDRERYQTVYARSPGSVAAPTAGLHFTPEVFDRLDERGVGVADVTLHVGPGTFRPIKADRIEDHQLHAEWAALTPDVAGRLNSARPSGGRVVAVGTTATRVLETCVDPSGTFRPFTGQTSIYLRPGVPVRGVDALVTNFHLPRSSLLVLVSALAGVDLVREAYAEAVRRRYRFYSFGDAMLIL